MKKLITLLFMILLVSTVVSAGNYRSDIHYKGERDILLHEGDRVRFDDFKVRVRDVDHIYKEATLDFVVNNKMMDRVTLKEGESYDFQGKIEVGVVNTFRRLFYKDEKIQFVRLEFHPKSKGKIGEIVTNPRFNKVPYVMIENAGITPEHFQVEARAITNSYHVDEERNNVHVRPFEASKVRLRVDQKNGDLADEVEVRLYQHGKLIEIKRVTI